MRGFDDTIWLLTKAAPTTMVKDRGWSLTITTRGVLCDGYGNGTAKRVLPQLLRGALHAGVAKGYIVGARLMSARWNTVLSHG
jgi:hypothetical protein